MSNQPLPDAIRRFVLTSIPSVPYLEALLLLRSDAQREWDARSVARRLYVPEGKAVELLRALQEAGVAARGAGEGCRYAPQDEHLRATIDSVEHFYATRLVEITALIHTGVDRRAVQFADAFRFKKEP